MSSGSELMARSYDKKLTIFNGKKSLVRTSLGCAHPGVVRRACAQLCAQRRSLCAVVRSACLCATAIGVVRLAGHKPFRLCAFVFFALHKHSRLCGFFLIELFSIIYSI